MEKGLFKKLVLLITYVIILAAVIVKIDAVGAWVKGVLSAFSPLLIGFVIAFILNRPCNFFARHYEKWFPQKIRRAARPLAVVTAYVVFFAVVSVIIALIVPELVRSIETFINNFGTYAANMEALYYAVVERFNLELLAETDLPTIVNENLPANLKNNTMPCTDRAGIFL